jgi:hypothetical protein
VRRVGKWDDDLVRDAVRANGGGAHVRVAFTMADQMWPSMAGVTKPDDLRIPESFWTWLYEMQEEVGAMAAMVTTGPQTGFDL